MRRYPLQSTITLAALLFAGLVEGIGISLLLPLLSLAADLDGGSASAAAGEASSTLGQMVNNVFGSLGITPTIGMLLIFFVVCMILKALLVMLTNKRIGYMVAQVATDLRLELIHALFVTRWEYFIRQPIGSLAVSIGGETGQAATAYLRGMTMIAAALQATVYATIVFLVSWRATVIALVAGLVILFVVRRYIRKARRTGKRLVTISHSMMSSLTDSLIMIKPLKTMGREHLADTVLEKKTEKVKKILNKQVYNKVALSAYQDPLTVIFMALGLYGVLIIWKMPLASVLVMVYMISKLLKRIQKVQGLYQHVVTAESAYWSYQSKLKGAVEEKESTSGKQQPSLNQSIRLEQIHFAYAD
jgi:ATP-binding cassette subfamily C protein